jgi:hypothetical protein
MKPQNNIQFKSFELQLSNGKIRTFDTGEEMYNWARQVRRGWKYEIKEDKKKDKKK